jgi:hypothetical protein
MRIIPPRNVSVKIPQSRSFKLYQCKTESEIVFSYICYISSDWLFNLLFFLAKTCGMRDTVNSRVIFTTHSRVMFTSHDRTDVYHQNEIININR